MEMPATNDRILTLRPHLRALPVKARGAFVLDGDQYSFLEGEAVAEALHLITEEGGRRQVKEGLTAMDHQSLQACLNQLVEDGVLYEEARPSIAGRDRFWSMTGRDPYQVDQFLAQNPVSVQAVGTSPAHLLTAFEEVGLRVQEGASATVVVLPEISHPALREVSEALRGRSWALVLLDDAATSGIFFEPSSPCARCLQKRIEARRQGIHFLQHHLGLSLPRRSVPGTLRTTHDYILSQIACQTATWLMEPESVASSTLRVYSHVTGQWTDHRLVGIGDCAACGQERQPPADFELTARKRNPLVSNGSRSLTAAQALERVSHLVDPILGPFQDLASIEDPSGALSYVIRHGMASKIDSIAKLKANEQHLSGGKGQTREAARASAIYEAAERYSGRWRPGAEVRLASMEELGTEAVHPHTLLGFSRRQYAHRSELNAQTTEAGLLIPEPFDSREQIQWVRASNLSGDGARWVPAAYVYYDHPGPGNRFCRANSNGCAAGGNLEEAILQGLLELIERDALGIWWMNRLSRPKVDLRAFPDPYVDRLIRRYQRIGRDVWVLDLTHDLAVPVYLAVSREATGPPAWVIGAGCHLSPDVALVRALSEMDQLLPAIRDSRRSGGSWFHTAAPDQLPFLVPLAEPASRLAVPEAQRHLDDIADEIRLLVGRLKALGLATLFVDQTDPAVDVPVARVMVPGLTLHWRRLGHDRLYDVPPALGWQRRLTEAEMNMVPLPF